MKKLQIISGICICICGMFLLSGCKFFGPCGLPCEEGLVCNEETKVCESDPCEGVACDDQSNCTDDSCVDGECVFTNNCEDGEVCDSDACTNLCEGVNCDDGDACTVDGCDSEDGSCTNEDMDCGNLDCDRGQCVDLCVGVDCDDKDACTTDSCSRGVCKNDPITCDDGFDCVAGACVDACETVEFECNEGFVCILGKCVKNLCLDKNEGCLDGFHCNPATKECEPDDSCSAKGKICHGNRVCVDGECVKPDPCANVDCEDDEECDDGDCIATDPCADIDCEDDEECIDGECIEETAGNITDGETYYLANGCTACHKADAQGPPSLIGEDAEDIFDKLSGNDSHVGGTFDGVTEQDARDLEAWIASL